MQLGKVPRIPLGDYPTPVQELANLRERLGRPQLLIKRDDVGGIGLGGNKLRKLEYALAEAKAHGATAVVTSGAVQSNHVRITIACANKLGLRTAVILRGEKPAAVTGNLLVDQLLGPIDVRFLDPRAYSSREELRAATEAEAEEVAAQFRRSGEVPYVIPNGCKPVHGALGYAGCMLELVIQLRSRGLAPDVVVTACGTAGTQTGLILGSWLYTHGQARVIGISVSGRSEDLVARIERHLAEVVAALGLGVEIPRSAIVVLDDYVGPGYAVPTDGMREALVLVARTEGILLDPVYTGKAMAGLIDLIRKGSFKENEAVVFLHTGGVPALFAESYGSLF